MNAYEDMKILLCAPYAVKADGTVLSVGGRSQSWSGVKKVCGDMALRWDGRVLTHDLHEERAAAIAKWRKVKDIACCGEIEGALLEDGDLVWIRSRIGQLAYGSREAGWTDVDTLFITRDMYDMNCCYGEYAVGLRGDGTVRVAFLGGGVDRSREIESMLNGVGRVRRISEDCRALMTDGTVWDFSTRHAGSKSNCPFPGPDRTEDGCVLLEDGRVQVPPEWYPGAEEWRQIVCISGCFLPIETGRHILMALRKDGQVLIAERYGNVPVSTSDWKLFDHPDTFAWEREKAALACISEGEGLDLREQLEQELTERLELIRETTQIEASLAEKKTALARTRGPFSASKRTGLERDIRILENRLRELNEKLAK